MQDTQHTQKTTTRTAHSQNIQTTWMYINAKHWRLTETWHKHLL